MGLEVNVTWGDSWRRPKEGLGRVVDQVQDAAPATRETWSPGDPAIDVYIYVSGKVWQHERSGVRLGTLSERGRNSLRVMIYVPDEITQADEAVTYFKAALDEVAQKVQTRLNKRRPDWPIDRLVAEILSLTPSSSGVADG